MIKQLEPKHLGISSGLLKFLAPEEDKRLSKLEAFRDLVEMATHFREHVSCYGQEFDLVPGEIITSISELAKKWRWQRATVRKFLDTLVELGQLIHTPHVKCSRMEIVSLRFKWLTAGHGADLLPGAGQDIDGSALDVSGMMTMCGLRDIDWQFVKGVFPLRDDKGGIVYTSEQRCEVAALYAEAMMMAFRRLVADVYTPGTERSLLDTFYGICHGSMDEAARLVDAFFHDEGHNINLMVWEAYGDTRDVVTRIFSRAFRELSERLPVGYVPVAAEDKSGIPEDKPAEADGTEPVANGVGLSSGDI